METGFELLLGGTLRFLELWPKKVVFKFYSLAERFFLQSHIS